MKQLRPIIITALLANIITFVLYKYVTSLPSESGMDLMFILFAMPVVWLTSSIVTCIILSSKREALSKKPILYWSILTFIFATPIPAFAIYHLTNPMPETRCDGELINYYNQRVYKLETWEITATHEKFADKYFVADSIQEEKYGDKAYKRDSIWVYYDNKGDTIKLEYYKDDSLILTKLIKKE
jgi:hypothetical protein